MYPQILKDFLAYLETIKGHSALTVKEYGYDISIFLKYIRFRSENKKINDSFSEFDNSDFNSKLLESVSLPDLYSYMSFLDNELNEAPRTRNRKISALRTFYDFIYNKISLISQNPTSKLESPKHRNSNPVYLTLDECNLLLSEIRKEENPTIMHRDYAMIMLFLNCGLRLSELVSINLDMIKTDILTVIGKGNKERTIYLNDACLYALNAYIAVRPKVEDKALFLSTRKNRISRRQVQYRIEKYLTAIGLDPRIYSVHKLRHTAATLLYKYGDVDIRALQAILGHESVATTQIYTHLDDDQLKNAIDKNPLNRKK